MLMPCHDIVPRSIFCLDSITHMIENKLYIMEKDITKPKVTHCQVFNSKVTQSFHVFWRQPIVHEKISGELISLFVIHDRKP